MQAVMQAGLRYLPLVLLALAWETVARLNLVDTSALPPLSKVASAWIDLIRGGELIDNGKASLYRGSVGLLLAIFGGCRSRRSSQSLCSGSALATARRSSSSSSAA